MTALALPAVPDELRWRCLSPGVYDSVDGRVTMYRIEGCYPPAWNVEWTTEYEQELRYELAPDVSWRSDLLSNIVDGARTFRDAKLLAADAWPKLRDRIRELEGTLAR